MTANKLKEKTLGRGWSQGSKRPIPAAKARLSQEEMMKVHPCSICMKFGHWSRQCPQNPKKKTISGEVEQTPREVRFTALVDSARRPGQDGISSFDLNPSSRYMETMVTHFMTHVDRSPIQVCGSNLLFSTHNDDEPFLIIDTACQKQCCSYAWADQHATYLRDHYELPHFDMP